MHVDLNKPALGQLSYEVSGVLQASTAWMVTFLNLFGFKQGNRLSPFTINIETPGNLVRLVDQFFRPPRIEPRGPNNIASTRNLGDNEVNDVDMEAPYGALVSEDEEDSPYRVIPNSAELSMDVIAEQMQDIAM